MIITFTAAEGAALFDPDYGDRQDDVRRYPIPFLGEPAILEDGSYVISHPQLTAKDEAVLRHHAQKRAARTAAQKTAAIEQDLAEKDAKATAKAEEDAAKAAEKTEEEALKEKLESDKDLIKKLDALKAKTDTDPVVV